MFATLLDQLQAERVPSSLLEPLIVERIAATLWRTRRVLAFESGAALERASAPESDFERLFQSLKEQASRDPERLERGRRLARAIAPADASDLAIRCEAHLTRELGRC